MSQWIFIVRPLETLKGFFVELLPVYQHKTEEHGRTTASPIQT